MLSFATFRRKKTKQAQAPTQKLSARARKISDLLQPLGLAALDTVVRVPVLPFGKGCGRLAVDDPEARLKMLAVFDASDITLHVSHLSATDIMYLVACLRGGPVAPGTLAHAYHLPLVQEMIEILKSED